MDLECIRTVTYSVLLNGRSHSLIKLERGLRQGDPLSPFIFILFVEALIHIMKRAEEEDKNTGLSLTCKCPSVLQLLFVVTVYFCATLPLKRGKKFCGV